MSTETGANRDQSGTALGAELKAARERRGLTLQQVAHELHVGEAVPAALERGDYVSLGPPIFVRGHLRAYAHLLGLGEDDVLARYEQEHDKPAPPPLVTQKLDSGIHRASPWIFSLFVVVVLCVLAVAWWMHRGHEAQNQMAGTILPAAGSTHAPIPVRTEPHTSGIEAAPTEQPATLPGKQAAVNESEAQHVAASQRHISKPVTLPSANAGAATAKQPQLPAADKNLTHVKFTLNQASWIEVYDASGKRLYYDLAPAGESVSVAGTGPLQVFLGNSPGVSIELDGVKFDQSQYMRADNTARFKLGGAKTDSGQAG